MKLFPLRAAVIVGVAIAVYSNAIPNEFVFDDIPNVLENRWIRDFRHIPDIFTRHLAGFDSGYSTSYYRPFIHLIYMLNYHIFGIEPWGFHLVNVLLHAAVSFLVFLVVSSVFREAQRSPSTLSIPLVTALLFAVHPIHVEAVSWVAGIMDLSYTFFYLLSLFLYICASSVDPLPKGVYFASLTSFFLSLLCKEPAMTLPLILIAYDAALRKEMFSLKGCARRYLPFLLVGGIYVSMRLIALQGMAPSGQIRLLSAYQYVINVIPLFWEYLFALLLPVNLSPVHPFAPLTSALETKFLISSLLTGAFTVISYRKRNNGPFIFGISLILIPLIPALYIPVIAGESVFAERYLYLPSLGFVMLIAILFARLQEKIVLNGKFYTALAVALIVIYSVGTLSRNTAWKDSYTLWVDVVRKNPQSAVAQEYLGYALYSKGKVDEAIERYRSALTIDSRRVDARINLGVAYAVKGWPERAVEQYREALGYRPGSVEGHMNLGLAYINLGRIDQAIEEGRIAVTLNPNYAEAHNTLGIAYAAKGWIGRAINQFQIASRLNPEHVNYRSNLEKAYSTTEKSEE